MDHFPAGAIYVMWFHEGEQCIGMGSGGQEVNAPPLPKIMHSSPQISPTYL